MNATVNARVDARVDVITRTNERTDLGNNARLSSLC